MVLVTHLAYAQSASRGPTLSESFSIRLSPYRDEAISQTIEALKTHYEFQRVHELQTANKDIFSRATDLLRFVPFTSGNSSGKIDDFFTPNYLRPDHAPPRETHLFDVK